jgi:hydrogenase maturation factor
VDAESKKSNVLLQVSPVTHVESWVIIPRGVAIKKVDNNVSHETTARWHHPRNKIFNVSGIQHNEGHS